MTVEVLQERGLGRRLLAWLSDRQDPMVDDLRRLAEIESPSLEAACQRQVFERLTAPLEEIGFVVRHLPGRTSGGCLYARPGRRTSSRGFQLLLGHSDTVWPVGTVEWMPVERDGDTLRGPGVFDMKGGLIQGVWALKALTALGVEPELEPVLLVNSDEEIGSQESVRHIRRLARWASRVFVLEPALGPEGRLKTVRKGVGHFEIAIRGRAAHAGLEPEKGASAILELSHVVQRLFALNNPGRGTTINVGKIDGGLRTNVVAPESRAWVDVRVLSGKEAARLEAEIRSLRSTVPGTSLTVSGSFDRPPLERTPANRALVRLARGLAAEELGIELQEATAGGGSDGNFTSPLAATLDGLGAVGDGAHAAHEQISVHGMVERATLLALLLAAPPVDGGPS